MDIAGLHIVDWPEFLALFFRFTLNLVPVILIVRYIYYVRYRRADYVFTFVLFNILIFFICSFLKNAQLSVGFGFGLFAVFAILRYRTETISIREMTYLFISIALAMLNALAAEEIGLVSLTFTNLVILAATYFLEKKVIRDTALVKVFVYDKPELLHPDKKDQLLEDIRNRTGLDVKKIIIHELDLVSQRVVLKLIYYE